MTPIAEPAPCSEQAPAIPGNLKNRIESAVDIEGPGEEQEVLYRLVDTSFMEKLNGADVKADEKAPVLSPEIPNGLPIIKISEKLKRLIAEIPQSQMPERILRIRKDGKCVACDNTSIASASSGYALLIHRLRKCPGTGSGARLGKVSAFDFAKDNKCLACNSKFQRNNLMEVAYHKLHHGCRSASKKEFEFFKSLIFSEADFPKELEIDLSQVYTEFAEKINDVTWNVPPLVYDMISKHLSAIGKPSHESCADCIAAGPFNHGLKSKLLHRLKSCVVTDSGKRFEQLYVADYADDNGACLACNEAFESRSMMGVIHHKLVTGCKNTTLKELVYLMSFVFKNAEEIIAVLKDGFDQVDNPAANHALQETERIDSLTLENAKETQEKPTNSLSSLEGSIDSVPKAVSVEPVVESKKIIRQYGKTKASSGSVSKETNNGPVAEVPKALRGPVKEVIAEDGPREPILAHLSALLKDGECVACGEHVELKKGFRDVISHKLHSCPALDNAKRMAGKPLSLFSKDKKCKSCGKEGWLTTWRDLVNHKLVDGCAKDQEEREFFLSLVFSGKELDAVLPSKPATQGKSQHVRPATSITSFAFDPEAVYIPQDIDEEICRACKCISSPDDHVDWNKTWIGCTECGKAYHRSCVQFTAPPLFNVTILPKPCNPLKLTAETYWTCPSCLTCDKCSNAKEVKQCTQCHKKKCSSCSPPRQDKLWSGQYYVCTDCQPACISCSTPLPSQRSLESLLCRRCQVNWIKGLHCPTCLESYGEEDEEEFPMIQCESCSVWVHFPCTGMSNAELKKFEGEASKSVYKCPRCQPLCVETTPIHCAACNKLGAQQYIAPGILAHPQCASLAKHLFSKVVHQRGALAERKGIRSVGLGTVQLRTWDIKPSVSGPPRSRHTWTLTAAKEGLYTLTSDGFSKHLFEASSLEEILENLRGLLTKQSLKKHKIDRIIGHFEEGSARLVQLNVPAKRGPEPTILIDPQEQPTKRLRRKKNSSTESLPPEPTSFLDTCTEDPLSCARTRAQTKNASKTPTAPTMSVRDDEPSVDSFNANFVPVRSDRLGQYRTASLPMAYRMMGSKQIEKGDLIVARSGIAGYGLFAGRKYMPNELVIEYQGEIIGQALADWRESRLPSYKQSCYMFRLDDARIIDATVIGNAARFINHCCQPNCRTKPVVIENQPRILIIAKKEIAAGEELSYDYQFALDEDDGKGRLPCYCGAPKCRGWMN